METDEPYVPLFLVDSAIAVANKFAIPRFNEGFVWGDYALDIKPTS